ncbi:MAG TPA: PhaM family polyhydroxyalkanoate granule multifunctional regulatory protein [Burkholderiales bacterium]|nr:PhaM family polyhydroxyalkanoate granule multifunctional regulatory protein [Burkholderiales bacterium]
MAEPTPPQDPFEMFRRLWGPLGIPLPGMAVPTFDPQEVEKRIAELKSVEAWLNMNLNMLKLSINGLEMQRAALQAMKSASIPPSEPPKNQSKE